MDNEEEIQLGDYYILYMDILGYKNAIEKAKIDKRLNDYFIEIKNIVKECLEIEEQSNRLIKKKIFSDNIVFVIRKVKNENNEMASNNIRVKLLCSIASKIQDMYLWKYGILFRGCITEGNIYIDENFIFGEGIINAYKLENECAFYPRVIIDPILNDNKYIRNSAHRIDKTFKFDNYMFINFLNYYMPSDKYKNNRDITRVFNAVDKLLKNTADQRALKKVRRVKNYLDDFYKCYLTNINTTSR